MQYFRESYLFLAPWLPHCSCWRNTCPLTFKCVFQYSAFGIANQAVNIMIQSNLAWKHLWFIHAKLSFSFSPLPESKLKNKAFIWSSIMTADSSNFLCTVGIRKLNSELSPNFHKLFESYLYFSLFFNIEENLNVI